MAPPSTTSQPTQPDSNIDKEFPYSLTISLPFPDHRLASTALLAIQVDRELSPLVRRTLALVSSTTNGDTHPANPTDHGFESQTVLRTEYRAATNRMLRVAVNGFMESLSVVLEVMQELDVDVLEGSVVKDEGRGVDGGGEVNGHV